MHIHNIHRGGRRVLIGVAAALTVAMGVPTLAQSGGQTASGARPSMLRLSMQQAVDMALESNLGLKAQRLNPEMASLDLASARAAFKPSLFSGASRNTRQSTPTNFTESTAATVTSSGFSMNAGVQQVLPWYGGSYQVNWSNNRSATTALSSFNPSLSSTVSFSFSQPLWRNFKVDGTRQNLKTTAEQAQITDIRLQEQIVATDRSVRLAYLRLIGAIESRKVAQTNLDVVRAALRNNQARVEVGTMAPNDIFDSQADVASTEEAMISAEASITAAQDALRALIVDPARPDYWQVEIEPTDGIQVTPRPINVDEAVKNALAHRTDLVSARKQLEITGLSLELLHNATLPSVNASVNYSANGVGGNQLTYGGSALDPIVLSSTSRSFGSALADAFSNNNPSWAYGVQVNYPIGQTAQQTSLARAKLSRQQQEIDIRELELQVATSVRALARQVETNLKRVEAVRKSLEAQEHRQDATNKCFAVGLTSTFELNSAQRDLARVRNMLLQTMIDYNQSVIEFEAVQKIR